MSGLSKISDRWFALTVALVVLAATQIPFEINRAHETAERVFTDSLTFPGDYSIYFSFVRQAAEGRLAFENRVTPEPNPPVFVNLMWLALGWLKALVGMSWAGLFHVWRLLGAVAYVGVFAALVGDFVPDRRARRIAIVVFATGGGLGWIFVIARKLGMHQLDQLWLLKQDAPADTYAAFQPLMQIFLFPFHACASALLALTLLLYVRAERQDSARTRLAAGVGCLLLGFVRPHEMTVAVGTIVLYGLARAVLEGFAWHTLVARCWIVLLSFPAVAYFAYVVAADPIFKWLHRQNVLPPLYPLDLVLTLGLVLVPALLRVGALARGARSDPGLLVLACWLVTVICGFYAYPLFTYSLEYGSAFAAPLVVLAFLPTWEAPRSERAPAIVIAGLLVLNAATSFWLLGHAAIEWRKSDSPAFIDRALIDAAGWLESHTDRSDVVLSFPIAGHWLLRYAGNKVFIASPVSTVDYSGKRKMVSAFYDPRTPVADKRGLLEAFHVAYVIVGPQERQARFDPAALPELRRVYGNGPVDVYRVDRGTVAAG